MTYEEKYKIALAALKSIVGTGAGAQRWVIAVEALEILGEQYDTLAKSK